MERMNRRDFLKALGFTAVAAAVPYLVSVRPADESVLLASGLVKGDIFTIAGVNDPNGGLQQFRVTSKIDGTSSIIGRV